MAGKRQTHAKSNDCNCAEVGPATKKSFVVKPWKLGLPPGLSYDNVKELVEVQEGPRHK